MKKTGVTILAVMILLCGCGKAEAVQKPSLNLVTAIDIHCEYQSSILQRHYTSGEKMDIFLFYLYTLSPQGRPEEDPEQLIGDSCTITLTMADGNIHTYRQQDNRYLSVDYRPWKLVDRNKADTIYHLIRHIESDRQ